VESEGRSGGRWLINREKFIGYMITPGERDLHIGLAGDSLHATGIRRVGTTVAFAVRAGMMEKNRSLTAGSLPRIGTARSV
jgi:hypothetical protein